MAQTRQNDFWRYLPFRLGTTSYIIPAGLAENAKYLSARASDMEFVLFDQGPDMCNIPDKAEVERLKLIAEESGLSYTIHLPLDLDCNPSPQEEHLSTTLAKRVIDTTLELNPVAYIAHLDGREYQKAPSEALHSRIIDGALSTINSLGSVLDNRLDLISLENLEGYPTDFTFPVLDELPIQQCIDVGHLWIDGHDPIPYLEENLHRTSVVHLHGLENLGDRMKDHRSLIHQPLSDLEPVWDYLIRHFEGVVSLEIFEEEPFTTSVQLLEEITSKELI